MIRHTHQMKKRTMIFLLGYNISWQTLKIEIKVFSDPANRQLSRVIDNLRNMYVGCFFFADLITCPRMCQKRWTYPISNHRLGFKIYWSRFSSRRWHTARCWWIWRKIGCPLLLLNRCLRCLGLLRNLLLSKEDRLKKVLVTHNIFISATWKEREWNHQGFNCNLSAINVSFKL